MKKMLVDTHAHLYLNQFKEDLVEVMERATENGVKKIFLPNIDSSTIGAMFRLVDRYPDVCYPMMGLHPCSVKPKTFDREIKIVEEWLAKEKFFAVGEIGIDLYWDKSTLAEQQQVFKAQIELAKKYDLPIVIHCRDAFNEIYEILKINNDDKLKGILHCFSGTLEQGRDILDLGGFKLGIGGVLTFPKGGIAEAVKKLPLESLVLETDAPYLSPAPHRGKRNESSYVKYVAKKIADLKEITYQEVVEKTTVSALEVFNIEL